MKHLLSFTLIFFFLAFTGHAQIDSVHHEVIDGKRTGKRSYFGIASYYADKFNGRQTANGEIYDGEKATAACNIVPLGSWIRVTNLRNNRSVIVKTNDRLHVRMKRIVDLSKSAAKKLGYIGRGLTQVKVEVLDERTIAGR